MNPPVPHPRVIVTCILVLACALLASACGRRASDPKGTRRPRPADTLTVFAAASCSEVMNEAATRFREQTGVTVVVSVAASSDLARQILGGAAADVFVSADERWMDEVANAGRLLTDSRSDLLANELVVICPAASTISIRPEKGLDLLDMIAELGPDARIALADPAHVPAGRYARESLEWLGWWTAAEPRLIPAADVRAALRLVELGEADLGIVYATDARASGRVRVAAFLPAESHRPVRYPIGVCEGANPRATDFVDFLRSPAMKEVFVAAGFTPAWDPAPPPPTAAPPHK